ncbi:hypothetical protein [Stenotrophomonas sp. GbtcB23]|uniref:hypothetical protein n=1 Tax=Stenotrophomonas sp. GbtcB23 TaxID=2824768 RepID=UPI001C309A72|nr:hypothetical protein [Stenotrophomonas sp. GbtcB23]
MSIPVSSTGRMAEHEPPPRLPMPAAAGVNPTGAAKLREYAGLPVQQGEGRFPSR